MTTYRGRLSGRFARPKKGQGVTFCTPPDRRKDGQFVLEVLQSMVIGLVLYVNSRSRHKLFTRFNLARLVFDDSAIDELKSPTPLLTFGKSVMPLK